MRETILDFTVSDLLIVAQKHRQDWLNATDFEQRAISQINYDYYMRVALFKTMKNKLGINLDCEIDSPEVFDKAIRALWNDSDL